MISFIFNHNIILFEKNTTIAREFFSYNIKVMKKEENFSIELHLSVKVSDLDSQ